MNSIVTIGDPLCIMIASPKGGVGKTITTFTLASEYFRRGYTVKICDCDPDGHLYRMWEKRSEDLEEIEMLNQESQSIDPEKEFPVITESNFSKILSDAKEDADEKTIILIDMPGQASTLFKEVLFEVDLIVTPMTVSEPDVNAIFDMKQLIDRSNKQIQRKIPDYSIPHVALFVATDPAIVTKTIKNQIRMVLSLGASVLKEHLYNRDAFKVMYFTGMPPYEQSKQENAANNAMKIADQIFTYILDGKNDVLIDPKLWFSGPDEIRETFINTVELVKLPVSESAQPEYIEPIIKAIYG